MNNDLISRAEVIDAVQSTDWYHQNQNGEMVHGANDREHQAWYRSQDVYAAIERVPSAQRKKGEWIIDRGLYKCSSCNKIWAEFWVEAKSIERMRKEMPYCPMCGADMRGEQDATD